MIDLIKVYFNDKEGVEKELMNNKFSSLNSKYYFEADKLFYPLRSDVENMRVNITEKNACIENSIHKYYNIINGKGNQNYNDFNYCDFIDACNKLGSQIGFSLEDTYLTKFELGFNICLNSDPTDFLEDNLLMYNYKIPCYAPQYKKRMKIKKFSLNEYEIKIYNKSLECGLEGKFKNILRVEVKYRSKRLIQRLGVFKLEDLKNKDVIKNIFEDYLKKIKEIIIVDDYKGSLEMSASERDFFMKCTNPNYWIDLHKNFSKNIRLLRKKRFLKLVEKYKLSKKRKDVLERLEGKFNELFFCDCNSFETRLIA